MIFRPAVYHHFFSPKEGVSGVDLHCNLRVKRNDLLSKWDRFQHKKVDLLLRVHFVQILETLHILQ